MRRSRVFVSTVVIVLIAFAVATQYKPLVKKTYSHRDGTTTSYDTDPKTSYHEPGPNDVVIKRTYVKAR